MSMLLVTVLLRSWASSRRAWWPRMSVRRSLMSATCLKNLSISGSALFAMGSIVVVAGAGAGASMSTTGGRDGVVVVRTIGASLCVSIIQVGGDGDEQIERWLEKLSVMENLCN